MELKFDIPKEVSLVTRTLNDAGFEAYLVGGCVRDLILGHTPRDWDVATNATPQQIQELFEELLEKMKCCRQEVETFSTDDYLYLQFCRGIYIDL